MSAIRAILLRTFGSAAAIGIVLALRATRRRLGIVLVYHGIGEPLDQDAVQATHAAELFEGQLRHLRRLFRVVGAAELLNATASRRRGGRFPAAVTFDDDLSSHARVALPILRRTRISATFFLCGASLSSPSAFWWELLPIAARRGVLADARSLAGEEREPLRLLAHRIESMGPDGRDAVASELAALVGPLSPVLGMPAEYVRELVDAGMQLGFHTRRHHSLPSLEDGSLAQALREGRAELAALAGSELRAIAYPHGRADERVGAAAREAGFTYGFVFRDLPVEPGSDPLLLPRIEPSYRSVGHFAMQLAVHLLGRGTQRPS